MDEDIEKITVENVNLPGHTTRVNAAMYTAMKQAMLAVPPTTEPGMTQAEIREAVVPHLPQDRYPEGAKAGWWAKTVQLDVRKLEHSGNHRPRCREETGDILPDQFLLGFEYGIVFTLLLQMRDQLTESHAQFRRRVDVGRLQTLVILK